MVGPAGKAFGVNILDVVAERPKLRDQFGRKIFVELDPHSDRRNAPRHCRDTRNRQVFLG